MALPTFPAVLSGSVLGVGIPSIVNRFKKDVQREAEKRQEGKGVSPDTVQSWSAAQGVGAALSVVGLTQFPHNLFIFRTNLKDPKSLSVDTKRFFQKGSLFNRLLGGGSNRAGSVVASFTLNSTLKPKLMESPQLGHLSPELKNILASTFSGLMDGLVVRPVFMSFIAFGSEDIKTGTALRLSGRYAPHIAVSRGFYTGTVSATDQLAKGIDNPMLSAAVRMVGSVTAMASLYTTENILIQLLRGGEFKSTVKEAAQLKTIVNLSKNVPYLFRELTFLFFMTQVLGDAQENARTVATVSEWAAGPTDLSETLHSVADYEKPDLGEV